MPDVVIVGAGPAGAVAATVLARAGARVMLVDRARFPRHKLCGDTLNPGTMTMLRRLGLADVADARGLRVDGMLVTGEGGVRVEGRYPSALHGRAISRAEFDAALVESAIAAGAELADVVTVRSAIVENGRTTGTVVGVSAGPSGVGREIRAKVTIAADGRHSTLAFALGLARHPPRPRRWAIGAYMADAHGTTAFGEMHIRSGHYIGVAPLPGGLTNVCLVKSLADVDRALRNPAATLQAELALEPVLRDRVASARLVEPPHVLGPLAVEPVPDVDIPPGLLLAGDASGFVDPMTGDGLRFAIRGGEIAAEAALHALQHGWDGVHARMAAERRHEFGAKLRFNRTLRTLVGSPLAVWAATGSARLAPSVVRALILRASDCDIAMSPS